MAYQALYRRLRPQRFEDVIGQRHITKTLKNQIANSHINHAYLFCGTRGTGKTSTARIFARAINCESEGEKPCNECEVCRSILDGRNVNITELDAASNNGVDIIREITEEVKYPPTIGKYRVYIIDEVHVLTPNAFNALLKTLEEPPAHVVFILATTDPQNLPVTVLSRCQRFDFHRISIKDMTETLLKFTQEEGIDADEEALSYISEVSDGAMRDALGLLDMCMSFYYGEKITAEKVREITGAVDRSIFFELTDCIASGNTSGALDITEKMVANGKDIPQFTAEYIKHLRDLLVARSVTEPCAALDFSEAYISKLRAQAADISAEYLINLIKRFSEAQNSLKYSRNPRIMLEVTIIGACMPLTDKSTEALDKRLSYVEEQLEGGVAPVQRPVEKKVEKVVFEKAVPEDIKNVINKWRAWTESVRDMSLRAFLEGVSPASMGDDEILMLVCPNRGGYTNICRKKDIVKELIGEYFRKDIEIKPILLEEYDRLHTDKFGAADAEIMRATAEEQLGKLNFDVKFIDE